jgi:hypothetical protein
MAVRRIIYTSIPADGLTPGDINAILVSARANNRERAVSGLLIYSSGIFVQALEGDDASVSEIFERIQADTRHHSVEVVTDSAVDRRIFADWSMGFTQSTAETLAACAGAAGAMDAAALSRKLSAKPVFPLMFMQAVIAGGETDCRSATAVPD